MRRSFSYLVASEQQLIQSLKRRNEDLMVTLDSLRQTQTQLSTAQRLVQTDELTGLCNRRGLYMFLEHLEEQRLPGTVLGLLLVDLDRFKQINDHCGHLIGDQVLRAIAEEVSNAASPCDLPCRLGGDEFALLMQVTGIEELRARATQIIGAVRTLRFPGGDEHLSRRGQRRRQPVHRQCRLGGLVQRRRLRAIRSERHRRRRLSCDRGCGSVHRSRMSDDATQRTDVDPARQALATAR